MKQEERLRMEHLLRNVPMGKVMVIHPAGSVEQPPFLPEPFSAKTQGKGCIETYSVFPGIEASYTSFYTSEITFHHAASPAILELFYCYNGRVGWNMQEGTALYLGPGDLTLHSAACCANSAMMLPLGYAEGLSLSIDLGKVMENVPEILQEAGIDLQTFQDRFTSGKPAVIPSCPELNHIFSPLYSATPARRAAYLKLKVQELLLYLADFQIKERSTTQYFSQQTDLIKEIHDKLTEHLDQRFTIDELAKEYLINTSTLKEVFKVVYGLPIATYMKEYRVRQAMKLLRETNTTIAGIASQVGYESQGKFTKAFKDVAKILPTEYRKNYRSVNSLSRE